MSNSPHVTIEKGAKEKLQEIATLEQTTQKALISGMVREYYRQFHSSENRTENSKGETITDIQQGPAVESSQAASPDEEPHKVSFEL